MKHILVVDDDQSVLGVLINSLSEFKLTVARDPDEALVLAGQIGVLDLVITDYLMPSMTGEELLGRLRERHPGVKALIVTAHADILDHEAPAWWTREQHLEKPFSVATLRQAVERLIGKP